MKIGIDLGGTETKVVLVGKDFKTLKYFTISTPEFKEESDLFSFLRDVLDGYLEGVSLLGFSIAGFIDRIAGSLISSPNLGISIVDLRRKLERIFKRKVFIENDVNCAAIYILKKFNVRDFLLLLVGTGLGSGVVSGGNLICGYRGFATEAGHMIYVRNGIKCGCGRMGCYESYCSGKGIERMKMDGMEYEEIIEVVTDALSSLADNLVTLLNPEKLFLGGGVIRNNHEIFEVFLKKFKDKSISLFDVEIELLTNDKYFSAWGATFLGENGR